MTRRLLACAALAAALLGMALSGPAAAETPITFALDFRALGRHAAWFLALDKGYYRQAGLDVSIIPSQGTAQALQSLEAGTVQFAFSDVAALVAARANSNATAKMIAVIYQKAPYAIFSLRSGADVTEPKQLEGLEIASGAGSFTQKVIQAFAAEKHLDPSKIKFTNIDPSARVAMLAGKKVPAIENFVMSNPGIVKALGADETVTFLLADHGLKLYSNGIIAKADYLAAHPDIAKAFVKASLMGLRDTIADPAAAADAFLKHNKGLDRETVLQEIEIVNGLVAPPEVRAAGLGTFDSAKMQASIDLIALTDTKTAGLKAADIADAAYLPSPPVKP